MFAGPLAQWQRGLNEAGKTQVQKPDPRRFVTQKNSIHERQNGKWNLKHKNQNNYSAQIVRNKKFFWLSHLTSILNHSSWLKLDNAIVLSVIQHLTGWIKCNSVSIKKCTSPRRQKKKWELFHIVLLLSRGTTKFIQLNNN